MKHPSLLVLLTTLFLLSACCREAEEPTSECQTNCASEPNVGPCNAAFPRFYFDPVEKRCKEFTWGGCAGVVPFETLEACEACGCD